ncbi:MAG: hypothetical protein I8H66_02665 [Sphingobacteriia bacterium]|nr:hypothetical protein [Sphingobacteriia bacterium]
MNIFKAVICHDYSVLRAQKRAIQVKTNGVHMIGIAWIANVLSIAGIFIMYFLVNNRRNDIYDLLFELHYWELAGRVGIIILLAFVYLISFAVFGGKQTFLSIIQEFSQMEEVRQMAVSRRGGIYFYGSLVVFIVVVASLLYLIKVAGY